MLYKTAVDYTQVWSLPPMVIKALHEAVLFVINFFAVGPAVALNLGNTDIGETAIWIGNGIAVIVQAPFAIASLLALSFLVLIPIIGFALQTFVYVPSILLIVNVVGHFFENCVGIPEVAIGL